MIHQIRPALASDVQSMTACVRAAYAHYTERIGKPPGPMLDDYAEVIEQHLVWVICSGEQVAGLIVLMEQEQGMLLDNVAVHPDYQGQGIGRQLMDLAEAEARRLGYHEIQLYTHIKMDENIEIYGKRGYVEVERRVENQKIDWLSVLSMNM